MKQHTNRILLIVLLVLLSAFVATKVFRSPARQSNLNTGVFGVDTAKVNMIRVSRPGAKELTLKKNDSSWTIQEENKSSGVEAYELNTLLGTLSNIKPERMISRKKEKWDNYQVGDSSAIRMTAYAANMDEVASWYIGRQSGGMTYLRPADENEVYVVEGNLRTPFGKDFNDWRDKSFLRIDKAAIDKISFRYPADSGFVVVKSGDGWSLNNQKADSSKIESYLYKLQSKDLTHFADNFTPASNPDIIVEFESNSITHAVIKGWKQQDNEWILNSGLRKDVYFLDSSGTDLFPGKRQLFHKGK